MTKLDKIYEKIPANKKEEGKILIDEMKFVLKTTRKLKSEINKEGAVENFVQGKQHFLRESPNLTAYNKLMTTYDKLFKNLMNLLPKDVIVEEDDGFEDFCN